MRILRGEAARLQVATIRFPDKSVDQELLQVHLRYPMQENRILGSKKEKKRKEKKRKALSLCRGTRRARSDNCLPTRDDNISHAVRF